MGYSENAQQPSKKRAAQKELSRDNTGPDDEEEDTSAIESGTFKTASEEEVLASRRIIKFKRQLPSSAPAPDFNPFDTTKEIIVGSQKRKSEAVNTGEGDGAENKNEDKKRKTTEIEDAAGEETNPGLDDEKDTSAMESGTFKTASGEVFASGRIIKVKRRHPSSAPACDTFKTASEEVLTSRRIIKFKRQLPSSAPAPAFNPFDGIRLVRCPDPAPSTPAAETTKPLSGSNSTPSERKLEIHDDGRSDRAKEINVGSQKEKSEAVNTGEGDGAENKTEDMKKTTEEIEDAAREETKKTKDEDNNTDTVKGTDCGNDLGGNQTEKEGKEGDGCEDAEKNGDSGALSSFQQHLSTKNAVTGLASTGFSVSSFSVGLVPQEGSTGSLTQQSYFSFGLPNNGNSFVSGASGSTSITKTTTAFPSKQDVSVEAGEENEKAAFSADSIMFEYLEGGWKRRGKGELKVNISTIDSRKARLVMRSKGNYRSILNASLYPEMKLAKMDKKGITFVCVNSASEAKNGLSTFLLKFKDPKVVAEFRAVIEAHKDGKPTAVWYRTS